MRITPLMLSAVAAALVACGTVSEQQSAPAPAPVAETQARAPAPVEVAPAPEPVAQSPAKPAPKPRAVKAVKVAKRAPPPAPAPVVPAGPSEQEIAAALSYVDEALGRYMVEQARFSAPATLKRDATGTATLEFSAGSGFDQARAAIAADERVRKAGIQISSRVQGRLSGENIGVKPGSPETQELTGTAGQWKWQLLPSAEGKALLHLVISVDTVVPAGATPRAVHNLDKVILIEAAAPPAPEGGFLANNWWWLLLLAILAAAGGWFATRKSS